MDCGDTKSDQTCVQENTDFWGADLGGRRAINLTSVRPSVETPRTVSQSLTGLLIPSAGSNTTASELVVPPREMV